MSALFSNDLLCSPWKGKARECAPPHHRRRHPSGVSSRERPRRINEEVTLACRGGLRRWRKADLQLSKGTSKFVLHCNRAFFWRYDNRRGRGNLTFERGCVWKSGSRVIRWSWRVCIIDTSTIDSRESQFRSSHRYARQSGEPFVGQFKSKLFVEYNTRWRVGQVWAPAECLTTYPPKDKLQLLCWWTLVWTFPPLCLCNLHMYMYFTDVSTWLCN